MNKLTDNIKKAPAEVIADVLRDRVAEYIDTNNIAR